MTNVHLLPELQPRVALCVGAHPDDIEFYCGATIAKLRHQGCQVTVVVCTDGSRGTFLVDDDRETVRRRRREEQANAAKLLGLEVVHLDYPDGELKAAQGIEERLVREFRRVRPDVLFCFDPWCRYELHPDHRASGFFALDAHLAAKLPLFYPEQRQDGLYPTIIEHIFLFNTDRPNFWLETDEHFEEGLAALFAHESQFGGTLREPTRHERERNAGRVGARLGVRHAEEFHRLHIPSLLALAATPSQG